ncbi:TPA: FprA family A-type flavoprotein [Candidatus Micrarchaeota archaeon]|nr:MAG: MBL fold hydrolase [Candidatus Micrarchaeota archaeon CG1_02_51_15]HII39088.1 FprA family A-type flavoprotein [Candidatus Micrarchaeota archaeon]
MTVKKMVEGIHWVGANHLDRRLFDELIPLPEGTSYNAYLVQGSQNTALIDSVLPSKKDELMKNLDELGVKKIDYVVANHAEQDHSGSIPFVLQRFPECKVVCNAMCKQMLVDFMAIPEDRFLIVTDRQTLSLGDKTLEFVFVPWVHWPETMFTFVREDNVLFTCDFLGSHSGVTELFAKDDVKTMEAAKRYYAEIMMPFRQLISRHLQTIAQINPRIVATSHGPAYDNPGWITNAYDDWVNKAPKNEAVIAYVSMYGSTAKAVERLANSLFKQGVVVKQFNLTKTDLGELAIALVDAGTIVLATPTVLGGPHPSAAHAAIVVNALKPKARFVSIICAYEWGGKTVDVLKSLLPQLKAELLEPVSIKGAPTEKDFQAIDGLAQKIVGKHLENAFK